MNRSNYINPEKCRDCGKCCQSFTIVYMKNIKDQIMLSEVERFKALETDKIIVKESKDRFSVTFDFGCEHLHFIEEQGFACAIYGSGKRPELCRSYPFRNTNDCPKMA